MKIDHAVLAVADLNDAAQRLRARTGLASIPGGRHPAWGTENRIVPLGAAPASWGHWVPATARRCPLSWNQDVGTVETI